MNMFTHIYICSLIMNIQTHLQKTKAHKVSRRPLRVSHDEHHAHKEHKDFFIIPEGGLSPPLGTPLKATNIEGWCVIETNKYIS
jgi:hypothetical protein